MTTIGFGRVARRVFYLIAACSLTASAGFATEPKSDLALEVRLVDTVVNQGALGRGVTGMAKIEIALDSLRDAHDVVLELRAPDGRPLQFRSRPVSMGPLAWSDPRGARIAPGSRGILIPARGRILTRLDVPLEGAAIHGLVVKAKAVSAAEEVETEAFVLVPVGVPMAVAVEDPESGLANFTVKEAN
jgi:hypothetical protein